jgi:penicillin G amidase
MSDPRLIDSSPARVAARPKARKRRWLRGLLLSVAGFVVLALVAAAFGVLRLRSAAISALPQLDGKIQIAGLSAPVTVQRDAHGVPHITAATQDDLFLAQGYVTAQDRLWQMDLLRRNANGELAEILGGFIPGVVRHDKMQRVFGIRNTARRIYASLARADRARLDDYARGVNLFIEQHQDALPPEFSLLLYKPQPWSGPDSISIGLMMVQTLDTHWDVKLAREEISADLKNPKLENDLYPVGSWRDHPPTGIQLDLSQPQPAPPPSDDDEDDDRTQTFVSPGAEAPDSVASNCGTTKVVPCYKTSQTSSIMERNGLGEDLSSLRAALGRPDCAGCVSGSNNWVISGKHTSSGKPLLSNDMHLGLTVPNIWYMADLRAPGFHAAGVTLPGMPFVIAGHNEHVAWGFTALMGDVQDLYHEKLDGKGNYQAIDGSLKPLNIDHEIIHVRGGKNIDLEVQSTEHGPLLDPLFQHPQSPISLKWTLNDPSLAALPLYEMNTASNWDEFSRALGEWCWPTQNVVYADDEGHIAYHAVGRIPLRPGGLAGKPISDTQHEWQGYMPFDSLPSAFDPPSGFLATANSRVTTDKSPYQISLEWVDPYRAERIYKALQGRDGLKPADMLAVQTDIYSEVDQELGHRFAYAIDHTPGVDDRLKKAADLMRSWDGRLSTDSPAASIVTQARKAFGPLVLEPKLGKDANDYTWSESNFAEEEIIMRSNADWLPKKYASWDTLLTDAVRKGMEAGKAPADVSQWRYGGWHVIDLEHPLASFLPVIGRIAGTGEQPLSGDTITVKQVGRAFGPSQRFTMDWSNVDGSTEDIVLGESGNPYSPYFRDQWNDYYGGTTFAFPFTQAALAAQTRHTLELAP